MIEEGMRTPFERKASLFQKSKNTLHMGILFIVYIYFQSILFYNKG